MNLLKTLWREVGPVRVAKQEPIKEAEDIPTVEDLEAAPRAKVISLDDIDRRTAAELEKLDKFYDKSNLKTNLCVSGYVVTGVCNFSSPCYASGYYTPPICSG